MHAIETCVLYGVVGVGMSIAVHARQKQQLSGSQLLLILGTILFWPLLGPLLLSRSSEDPAVVEPQTRIATAQQRLATALASLDGLASEAVTPEVTRVRGLTGSLAAMEQRLREMDALLATPEFDHTAAEQTVHDLTTRGLPESDARLSSARGRLRNIARLREMRERTAADLERVLLQIEEMSAQLKLLKFAGGATDGREAVGIIRQVADGLQEMTEAVLAVEPTINSAR